MKKNEKFVGCSFVTCSIWQYESHRYKISQLKQRWQLKTKSFHEKNQFLLSVFYYFSFILFSIICFFVLVEKSLE